jgi:nucleotide-binding universal stress UspA family protein
VREMSIFPTTVLLVTDGSEEAALATEAAVEISNKTASELHVVHVYGIVPIYPSYPEAADSEGMEQTDPVLEEELESLSVRQAQEVLDAAVEKVHSVGGTVAQAHLREGGVPQAIVSLAEDTGVGLIVMGSRGRGGIRRALMGSVSASVVRHAHCPVLVVRDQKENA